MRNQLGPHVVRYCKGILDGYFVQLNGPFEYAYPVQNPQLATQMPAWKAFGWAEALGAEAVAITSL
jgi:hypothetical protein